MVYAKILNSAKTTIGIINLRALKISKIKIKIPNPDIAINVCSCAIFIL